MKLLFNILEKVLLSLLILSMAFLIIIQFFSYDDSHTIYTAKINRDNRFFSSIGLEADKKGIIILKNMTPEYKKVDVLVNGDYADSFIKSDEVEIQVYDNDVIEIDGSKYNNKLEIKIVGISSNVDAPKLDTVITTFQSIEILSRVQLK